MSGSHANRGAHPPVLFALPPPLLSQQDVGRFLFFLGILMLVWTMYL
eukprot:gene36245-3948_t